VAHPVGQWIVIAAASLMVGSGVYAAHRAQEELLVAFDLPGDYWQRTPEREYWVTGLRLGYFRANGQFPLMVVEFDRESVIFEDEVAQLPLDVPWLSTRRDRIVVRLQSVTLEEVSEWSDPSEVISLPAPLAVRTERSLAIRAGR
jgi:hypothetical protein